MLPIRRSRLDRAGSLAASASWLAPFAAMAHVVGVPHAIQLVEHDFAKALAERVSGARYRPNDLRRTTSSRLLYLGKTLKL